MIGCKEIAVIIIFISFWFSGILSKHAIRKKAKMRINSGLTGWIKTIETKNEIIESKSKMYKKLQVKYDNAERELKERDKQYRELLERTNKDND